MKVREVLIKYDYLPQRRERRKEKHRIINRKTLKKINRQDAKNAKLFIAEKISLSWRPWRLGGSKSYSFC